MSTCVCGETFTLAAHLAQHRKNCLGPTITFWALMEHGKVVASGGCWLWGRKRNGYGYGVLTGIPERQIGENRAHRAAWSLWNEEPIPDGLIVLHSCDTPACVNPTHLRVGTKMENSQEMIQRGRGIAQFQPHADRLQERECPICGARYLTIKWRPSKTCSPTCGGKLSWRTAPSRDFSRRPDSRPQEPI